MSGGSFEYLCFKDAGEILSADETLRRMADELEALDPYSGGRDYKGPADRTRALLAQRAYIQKEIDALSDLWRAVEWWRSCDWSRDQALDALGAYRERTKREAA